MGVDIWRHKKIEAVSLADQQSTFILPPPRPVHLSYYNVMLISVLITSYQLLCNLVGFCYRYLHTTHADIS